jgi:hypothetical protein
MNARDWRFPMACPSCDAMAGTPHCARADHETLSLGLRCTTCRNEWEISAPCPALILKIKPDRRKPTKSRASSVSFVAVVAITIPLRRRLTRSTASRAGSGGRPPCRLTEVLALLIRSSDLAIAGALSRTKRSVSFGRCSTGKIIATNARLVNGNGGNNPKNVEGYMTR